MTSAQRKVPKISEQGLVTKFQWTNETNYGYLKTVTED